MFGFVTIVEKILSANKKHYHMKQIFMKTTNVLKIIYVVNKKYLNNN